MVRLNTLVLNSGPLALDAQCGTDGVSMTLRIAL